MVLNVDSPDRNLTQVGLTAANAVWLILFSGTLTAGMTD